MSKTDGKIKLSIGILVSNRIKYIRKAMEALKPLLEAVPCELIAVDTKGADGDGSIEIVREYTDKIYPFTWCNDFAAARNVCIEHATGEWFMYQDDDEWFDDVQELINFFASGECDNYLSAYYYVKNYDIMGNSELAVVGRMVRMEKDTRFVGKVHESFNAIYLPCKQFQCFVHHMGYVYFTDEEKKEHQNRNLLLLKEEINNFGYTTKNCAQMIQELLTMEDTAEEGMEFALKSIGLFERQNLISDSLAQWILIATIKRYFWYGSYTEMKNQAKIIRNKYPLSQVADMVLSYLMLVAANVENDVETVLTNVKKYIEYWDWMQNNPDEALCQTSLDFPMYANKERYYDALYKGAVIENQKGNFREAMVYWNRMPWKEEGFDGSGYFAAFQETHAGYKEMLEKVQQEQNEIQKEIEELISILLEAKSVIMQYVIEVKKQDVVAFLTEMQDVVIALGNKIEMLLGEGTSQIRVLEDCCELLWQCANEDQPNLAINILEEFYDNIRIKIKEELSTV